jgi:hypothetical protein
VISFRIDYPTFYDNTQIESYARSFLLITKNEYIIL